jgi:hypothetical protein
MPFVFVWKTRSCLGYDQLNRVDEQIFEFQSVNFVRCVQTLDISEIVYINGHRICELVSSFLMTIFVNPFKYLIHEILLVTFLFLRQICRFEQSVPSENIVIIAVLEPIVYEILWTISAGSCANIQWVISVVKPTFMLIIMCAKFLLTFFLSTCNSVLALSSPRVLAFSRSRICNQLSLVSALIVWPEWMLRIEMQDLSREW